MGRYCQFCHFGFGSMQYCDYYEDKPICGNCLIKVRKNAETVQLEKFLTETKEIFGRIEQLLITQTQLLEKIGGKQ